ncbi:glycosyltransferase 87 family protein [Plantactinospora sp. CA-290183]|uniref:glycosyltransferase 87 family protein n=1 Tax=Plantactinospora sp. CA-290183 TaxID=3240006 RepID=UPI003D9123E1
MSQGAFSRARYQVPFVIALAVLVTGFLTVAAVRHGFFDLRVYYGALHHWVAGGEIYDWLKPNSKYGFTYPPFAALVMLPMAYVSWHVATVISVILTVLASALLIWWLVDPIARRTGWTRWFVLAVALCLAAAFEPMRETVNFGQVNMLLLFLVGADLLWLVAPVTPFGRRLPARYRWFAGVGIGLATAIKLTPGIFIVYLLVTQRWRAAIVASGTAAGATLVAGAVAPDASREFWTTALWDTDRVGSLSFISNQSWQGVVARIDPDHPSRLLWLLLVVATLVFWAWRSRSAVRAGDEATGFALTGVVGCLISPVTWVHHLVWLIPALILLVDNAYAAPARSLRRRYLLGFAIFAYLVLISRLVWIWERRFDGLLGFLGSNAYVWISVALLVVLPVRGHALPAAVQDVPELDQPKRRPSPRPLQFVGRPLAIGD